MSNIEKQVELAYHEIVFKKYGWSDKRKRTAFVYIMKQSIIRAHSERPTRFLKYSFLFLLIALIDMEFDFDYFTYVWYLLSVIEFTRFIFSLMIMFNNLENE